MKSTTNLRKQIITLKSQVEAVQEALNDKCDQYNNEVNRRYTAEREVAETRKQFADLKERLRNAELENARNEGYLQRVREDDAVTDPLVEVEGPEGKRWVSKRHPSPVVNSGGLSEYMQAQYEGRAPKNWVNY